MAEMTKKLVVVMDLGRMKAFRLEDSPQFSHPRLVLLEDHETGGDKRISEQVTDQAGQFSKGSLGFAAVNDMSNGEQHNLELEGRRRAIKESAKRIAQLLEQEKLEGCYFAAAREINQTVLDTMDQDTRKKIERNVAANLTRLSTSDIIDHFCTAKKQNNGSK